MNAKKEITVEDIVIDFPVGGALFKKSYLRAANEASLTLRTGEALAIVGESGSGKSTCAGRSAGSTRPRRGGSWWTARRSPRPTSNSHNATTPRRSR